MRNLFAAISVAALLVSACDDTETSTARRGPIPPGWQPPPPFDFEPPAGPDKEQPVEGADDSTSGAAEESTGEPPDDPEASTTGA